VNKKTQTELCLKIHFLGPDKEDDPTTVVKDCKVRHVMPQMNILMKKN